MKTAQALGLIGILVVVGLVTEGINYATDGALEVAAMQQIAQATLDLPQEAATTQTTDSTATQTRPTDSTSVSMPTATTEVQPTGGVSGGGQPQQIQGQPQQPFFDQNQQNFQKPQNQQFQESGGGMMPFNGNRENGQNQQNGQNIMPQQRMPQQQFVGKDGKVIMQGNTQQRMVQQGRMIQQGGMPNQNMIGEGGQFQNPQQQGQMMKPEIMIQGGEGFSGQQGIQQQEGQPQNNQEQMKQEAKKQMMQQMNFQQDNGEGDEDPQDFIDPREVKQAIKEIKQMKTELKRFTTQLKKIANSTDDVNQITEITSQLDKTLGVINNSSSNVSDIRDAIQEYRDNQYWEQIQKIRAKVELPKQIKDITSSLKRAERLLKIKTIQNLGLDLNKVQTTVNGMKENLAKIDQDYKDGNLESAMETMQEFNENGHPGEIESTIYRIRDIKTKIKQLKNETLQIEINKVLQEVIVEFNDGNYRSAREIFDEYNDDMMRLINAYAKAKIKKGASMNFSDLKDLDEDIKAKIRAQEEVRAAKEQKMEQQAIPQETSAVPTTSEPQAIPVQSSVPVETQPVSQ